MLTGKFVTDTEAKVVVAVAGRLGVALGGAYFRPVAAVGATASDPVRARCRSRGIGHRTTRVR